MGKKLEAARKGTGHPTSLCRRLRICVSLTGTPSKYGIVHGAHPYLYLTNESTYTSLTMGLIPGCDMQSRPKLAENARYSSLLKIK